jgi:Leucine-rich repeat (LRR) protein
LCFQVLDLKGNDVELDFHQIPPGSKLEFLRLSGTGLHSIEGISRAIALKDLHVTNNEIRSIPEEIYGMESLEYIFLSFNSITGTISRNIGRLTHLKELYMFGNHLTGTIPTNVGLMTELTEFVAANNFLSGELPTELSSLPKLEQLSIYDQEGLELISGKVPSFSAAPNLWYVYLCRLAGEAHALESNWTTLLSFSGTSTPPTTTLQVRCPAILWRIQNLKVKK